jgi:molybdopterin/thiamine biosynthesis adenylyltransferase
LAPNIQIRGETNIQNNLGFNLDPVTLKNFETLSIISKSTDINQLRTILDSFRVEVIMPQENMGDVNAEESCCMALNLLPRFLRCVRYNGPTKILKRFPPSHTSKINLGSDEWKPNVTLIFGNNKSIEAKNPIYISSVGWSIYISRNKPCSWNIAAPNRISGMYAGALAVGEVFKDLIPIAKMNKISHLEYDLVTHGRAKQPLLEPQLPDLLYFNNSTLIGCGAIGQTLVYALKTTFRLVGRFTLIDHDKFEASNEQRYIGAFEETRNLPKTDALLNWLSQNNAGLSVIGIPQKYEEVATITNTILDQEVIVAVDNIETRLNVQAALPKLIWNAWTDTGEGTLRYGIGRHMINGDYECLACSYFPKKEVSEIKMIATRTGFPEGEIRERLSKNDIITNEDIQRVAKNKGFPLDKLVVNIGKSFKEFLHGECGLFRLPSAEMHAITPAPHTPVLAGLLLATQLVLSRIKSTESNVIESTADFDALGIPNPNCIIKKRKNPNCFCSDPDYVKVYNSKWE